MRRLSHPSRACAGLLTLALLLAPGLAMAHGALHLRVAALTALIDEEPSADHYLERSLLHREHGDLEAALADLEQAVRLDPAHAELGLHGGRLALEAGRPAEAVARLEGLLEDEPNHAEANLLLARALAALGSHRLAADHYARAVATAPVPIPDHYLEWANALELADAPEAALAALDGGISRLGPVIALAMRAIEIERAHGRVDAALIRVDRLRAIAARQETWLARRADILEDAGRSAEARAAWLETLAAIESLPVARRTTPATLQLEASARMGLARSAGAEDQPCE